MIYRPIHVVSKTTKKHENEKFKLYQYKTIP